MRVDGCREQRAGDAGVAQNLVGLLRGLDGWVTPIAEADDGQASDVFAGVWAEGEAGRTRAPRVKRADPRGQIIGTSASPVSVICCKTEPSLKAHGARSTQTQQGLHVTVVSASPPPGRAGKDDVGSTLR
jgi:hypothetical protein